MYLTYKGKKILAIDKVLGSLFFNNLKFEPIYYLKNEKSHHARSNNYRNGMDACEHDNAK